MPERGELHCFVPLPLCFLSALRYEPQQPVTASMLRYRHHATAAHIAPLAVFLLLTSLVPLVAVKNSALPWWRSAPEHWIYPVQTVVCGALLLFFRGQYTFRPFRGYLLAT